MSYKKHLRYKFKKSELKNQNNAFFYFPKNSRYNFQDTNVFSNNVELSLLLCYTSMLQKCIKFLKG